MDGEQNFSKYLIKANIHVFGRYLDFNVVDQTMVLVGKLELRGGFTALPGKLSPTVSAFEGWFSIKPDKNSINSHISIYKNNEQAVEVAKRLKDALKHLNTYYYVFPNSKLFKPL